MNTKCFYILNRQRLPEGKRPFLYFLYKSDYVETRSSLHKTIRQEENARFVTFSFATSRSIQRMED